PTNLYGPNDNFDLEKSHVLPALIRKMHLGKLLMEGKEQAVCDDLGVKDFAFAKAELEKHGITDKGITLWGTGTPKREFLWSHDMAKACVFLMLNVDFKDVQGNDKDVKNTHLNIGTGEDIAIKDLADMIKKTIGYKGTLNWDSSKPDGTPRKLTNVSKLHKLGWKHEVALEDGLKMMYTSYLRAKTSFTS
ncbi:MAG: NAD-dependent epimerase/dehydratase family protein, partial [Nonlabens sp.]|nr:NAD-dependent epimerase/dehydratase family protein [Nonlabens sp.]